MLMKSLVLATLLLVGPALAIGQTKPAPKKSVQTTSRPAAKANAKATSSAKRTKGKAKGKGKGKVTSASDATNRDDLRSAAAQMAAGTLAADRALTPAELELADRVQTGRLPCELGNVVELSVDPKAPGHFDLVLQKMRYRMTPVETQTGALRLEDAQNGIVWLQLGNKSMLMNQKIGQRLADECQSPKQLQVADAMKRAPQRSLLDAEPSAASPAPADPAADGGQNAEAAAQDVKAPAVSQGKVKRAVQR